MSKVTYHPLRGNRVLLGLAVAVSGLSLPLALVMTGPSVASAVTVDAASNSYVVYLLLPGTFAGGGTGQAKGTASSAVREELTAFSLSTTAAAPGPGGKAPTRTVGSATAAMAINKTSVELLHSVTAASKLSVEVYFQDSASGALALSYKFTSAVFTSYLLQDGPTGDAVQVTFTYQQLAVDYIVKKPIG